MHDKLWSQPAIQAVYGQKLQMLHLNNTVNQDILAEIKFGILGIELYLALLNLVTKKQRTENKIIKSENY